MIKIVKEAKRERERQDTIEIKPEIIKEIKNEYKKMKLKINELTQYIEKLKEKEDETILTNKKINELKSKLSKVLYMILLILEENYIIYLVISLVLI